MTLRELIDKLGLTVLCEGGGPDTPVEGGYTCDLLSDVMGHAAAGRVWITLQAHRNVVAIASLRELAAVILVKGIRPDADTLELARREGVAILGSTDQAFELSGRVFELLGKAES